MATPNLDELARRFASLFDDPAAQEALARLSTRTTLPIFNMAISSLRHLPKWFDRLENISNGQLGAHGNFTSDPASIGLVDNSVAPPVLTSAGKEFFSYKSTLYGDPARAEYQLLKILYFSNHAHSAKVQGVLASRMEYLLDVLRQFGLYRQEFLAQPSLLVIAELIASFPNALPKFVTFPAEDLLHLAQLSEENFKALCTGDDYPAGLARLCNRIAGDYTRAQERRLHHIVSMALLTIASLIPPGGTTVLRVPAPYSNLLTKRDIFNLHATYTSDLAVWFDGVSYLVSTSISPAVATRAEDIQPHGGMLRPKKETARTVRRVSATDSSRNKRRAAQQEQITVINPLLSEDAEDFAERELLRPMHGAQIIRAGHRIGETMPLPDGLVPGADFYLVDDDGTPTEFIEVKCISGGLPANISLTHAEYLRVCKCVAEGIPYGILLVDLAKGQCIVVDYFDEQLAQLGLADAEQFTIKVWPLGG